MLLRGNGKAVKGRATRLLKATAKDNTPKALVGPVKTKTLTTI
jgi:hypothetical protein